jgi:hypothetical protein
MRCLAVLTLLGRALAADPDANEIVRRCVNRSDENWKKARFYTFVERVEERELDGNGALRKTESETFDVTMLDGSPYRRRIQKDDKPLPPKEQKKEQDKLNKSIEERRRETESQRAKRVAEGEKRRARNRDLIREVAQAFDFKLAGEDTMGGRQVHVLEATPRPGYKPKDSRSRILLKVKGKLWIDKADYTWVRAEAEAIDTISFGVFLVRMARGAHIEIQQTRVNDEVWLPQNIRAQAAVRFGLVKTLRGDFTVSYRDYKKFSVDSLVVPTGEIR